MPRPGALRRAHDGDLVDDHVAALERRAEAVAADREDDHQRRDRHPRPLALVEPAQDQVVDRADERDVGEQQHEQLLDRRQVDRGQVLQRVDDLRVVGDRKRVERRAGSPGQQPMPQGVAGVVLSAIQRSRRVEADERH